MGIHLIDEVTASEIIRFTEEYIETFASWDLLAFFHENPTVERTISMLAADIGRSESSIRDTLGKLVENGLVSEKHKEGGDKLYAYTAPYEFKIMMERFLDAIRDRTMRLAIVSIILKKEAKRI